MEGERPKPSLVPTGGGIILFGRDFRHWQQLPRPLCRTDRHWNKASHTLNRAAYLSVALCLHLNLTDLAGGEDGYHWTALFLFPIWSCWLNLLPWFLHFLTSSFGILKMDGQACLFRSLTLIISAIVLPPTLIADHTLFDFCLSYYMMGMSSLALHDGNELSPIAWWEWALSYCMMFSLRCFVIQLWSSKTPLTSLTALAISLSLCSSLLI